MRGCCPDDRTLEAAGYRGYKCDSTSIFCPFQPGQLALTRQLLDLPFGAGRGRAVGIGATGKDPQRRVRAGIARALASDMGQETGLHIGTDTRVIAAITALQQIQKPRTLHPTLPCPDLQAGCVGNLAQTFANRLVGRHLATLDAETHFDADAAVRLATHGGAQRNG